MFNIKNLVNRITNSTDDGNAGDASSSQAQASEDQHSAEGFLCPDCMTAFSSPDALKIHYEDLHQNQSEISEHGSLNFESSNEINMLQQEIQDLQECLSKEKSASDDLKRDYIKLQNDLKEKTVSLKRVEQELNEANALLQSDVKLRDAELAGQREKLSQLSKQNDLMMVQMTNEIEKFKHENNSLKTQLAHRNSVDDAEVLKKELVSVQHMMDQLSLVKEEQIQILRKEVDDLNNLVHEKEQTFRNAQIEFCDKLNAQNPSEVQETQNALRLEQYLNSIQELQVQLTEVRDREHKLSEDCENYKSVEENLETAKVQIDELSKNIVNLRIELNQSKSEHSELSWSLESEKKAQLNLIQKLEQKDTLIEELHKLRHEIEQNLIVMKKEHEEVAEKSSLLEAKLSVFSKEMIDDRSNFEVTSAKLKAETEAALGKAINYSNKVDELQKKLTTVEAEKDTILDEKRHIKEELVNTAQQNKETEINYKATISSLENKLTKANRSYSDIQHKQNKMEESVELAKLEMQRRIEMLNSNEKEQQIRIQKYEKDLSQAKLELIESNDRFVLLQNQSDAILVDKLEYEKNIKSSEQRYAILLERCLTGENEKEKLGEVVGDLRRKLEDSSSALQELGRENQALVMESYKLNARQWTDDSLVTTCSTCVKEFTLTNRKHHCRHCGQIFCKDCSSKTAKIPSSKNPVRVCEACYEELMPK